MNKHEILQMHVMSIPSKQNATHITMYYNVCYICKILFTKILHLCDINNTFSINSTQTSNSYFFLIVQIKYVVTNQQLYIEKTEHYLDHSSF